MSTTKLKIKGWKKVQKVLQAYPEMAERAANWKPVQNEVHNILLEDYAQMYKSKRNRPGEMERLGPSLTRKNHPEHIFRMEDTGFVFGTEVPYSFWYMQWRKSQRRRSHIQFRAKARRAVGALISEWIANGRG